MTEGTKTGEASLSKSTREALEEFVEAYWMDADEDQVQDADEYARRFPHLASLIPGQLRALEECRAKLSFETSSTIKEGTRDDTSGETFGRYHLVRLLGQGAQGSVHLAFDPELRRSVALKILHRAAHARTRGELQRFEREALIASRLDHPGICTIYEAGTVEERPFIAMRYAEGRTLAEVFAGEEREREDESTRMPSRETDTEETRQETTFHTKPVSTGRMRGVAELFVRIARAVHHAHENGVVHRDLKPGNVMLSGNGDPIVLDFGLAGDEQDLLATLSREGDILGTPAYMAPEQVRGELSRVGRRTDVHALGLMLFEALTGTRAFQAPTRARLFHAIENDPAPDPRRRNPRIPRDLASIVQVALEKDPERRYATAADFADDLERFLEHRSIHARPAGPFLRAARWVRRNRIVTVATTTVIVTLTVAFLSTRISLDVALAAERDAREQEALALRRQAQLELRNGRYRAALEVWDRIEANTEVDAHDIEFGRITSYLGLLDEREVLERIANLEPTKLRPALAARALLLRGDFLPEVSGGRGRLDVEAALASGVLPRADEAYAHALLAEDAITSLNEVERALRIEPEHVFARELKSVLLFLLGREQELARYADYHRSAFPEDPRSLVLDLQAAVLGGDTERATSMETELDRVLESGPRERVRDLVTLARGMQRAAELLPTIVFGEPGATRKLAREYAESSSNMVEAAARLGRPGCRSFGLHILSFKDEFAHACEAVVQVYLKKRKTEDIDEALTRLRRSRERLPHPTLVMIEAGTAAMARRVKPAVEAARLLLEHPEKRERRLLAAGCLTICLPLMATSLPHEETAARAAVFGEAMEHAEDFLELEDLSAPMHAMFSELCAACGAPLLAYRYADAWARRFPDDLNARYQLAQLDREFGAIERARKTLDELLATKNPSFRQRWVIQKAKILRKELDEPR